MSSTNVPPEGGFVRVPHAWIYLPITPPAKALLVALCAYANDKGQSWCSYEQLGDILGRSRASVTSYVAELKKAGLIGCDSQTFGNGYNYRVKITLLEWKNLLAHWSGLTARKAARKATKSDACAETTAAQEGNEAPCPTTHRNARPAPIPKTDQNAQKSERSVQDAECKDPSGPITKIQQTKTPGLVWTNADEAVWKEFRSNDSDPVGSFGKLPPESLMSKVLTIAAQRADQVGLLDEGAAIAQAKQVVSEFVHRRQLSADDVSVTAAAKAIAAFAKTKPSIAASIDALDTSWQPHWKRLSGEWQITQTCKPPADAVQPGKADMTLAGLFQKRAYMVRVATKSPRSL
ncbi:helix-turn-helix domain-containing protein [Loktanella sp. DJP18]|uniref:helix-turn-helix domain-containing protein n=1 Tax=Loktanella sp. DJP18 TaxID=3409788 RepID=UPI003BB6C35B